MAAAFCRIARFDGTDTIGSYHGVKTEVAELMARSLLAGVLCFAGNPSPEELPRRATGWSAGSLLLRVPCFADNPSPEELPRRTTVMEVGHV